MDGSRKKLYAVIPIIENNYFRRFVKNYEKYGQYRTINHGHKDASFFGLEIRSI